MVDAVPRTFRNQILAGFTEAQLGLIAPHLEPVELPVGTSFEAPGQPIEQVHFPASGFASVVAIGLTGKRIETGLFGRDGMSGLPIVLGADRSPHEVFMQGAGSGHRIEADALREAMAADPVIRDRFLRFVHFSAVQVAATALANGQNTVEARLARWLLMCHDRTDRDLLDLTHEFVALMLGVRRAGVTVAVHMLEGRGVIRATRGRIHVIDRVGLEAAADGAYGVPEAEYERLLGTGRVGDAGSPGGPGS